mmetsp:Transcript_69899/g.166835  ORF Transcript_69899/g.166835 Transcript_69899/m.166835 type:complete len:114 (-) Transcript_69899:1164-1505(-)
MCLQPFRAVVLDRCPLHLCKVLLRSGHMNTSVTVQQDVPRMTAGVELDATSHMKICIRSIPCAPCDRARERLLSMQRLLSFTVLNGEERGNAVGFQGNHCIANHTDMLRLSGA